MGASESAGAANENGDPGESSVLDTEETGLIAEYEGTPTWVKLGVLAVIVVVVAVVLGVWHTFYFHWFEVHSGTVNESGPYYGFWSGFGSDLGEATIVVGIVATWRHHNCHVKGCARLGRQVAGTPYLACPKHHPDHKGYKRGVSLDELHGAHKKAKQSSK
jgi:hypothetical protein